MNKQNLNRNITSILQKPSPFKTKDQHSQLSFRHLNNKSLLTHQGRSDTSVSPIPTKRNKTINSKLEMSGVNTEPSESMIMNANNSNLVQAFQMERQSLVNTLKMYKEQIDLLTKENTKMKDDLKKCKNHILDRENRLKEKAQQSQEMVQKVKEYQNMLPKIIELENLQENVIKENGILKNKIKIQQSLLSNVVSLAKTDNSRSPIIQKILSLTQCYLANSMGAKQR